MSKLSTKAGAKDSSFFKLKRRQFPILWGSANMFSVDIHLVLKCPNINCNTNLPLSRGRVRLARITLTALRAFASSELSGNITTVLQSRVRRLLITISDNKFIYFYAGVELDMLHKKMLVCNEAF